MRKIQERNPLLADGFRFFIFHRAKPVSELKRSENERCTAREQCEKVQDGSEAKTSVALRREKCVVVGQSEE